MHVYNQKYLNDEMKVMFANFTKSLKIGHFLTLIRPSSLVNLITKGGTKCPMDCFNYYIPIFESNDPIMV